MSDRLFLDKCKDGKVGEVKTILERDKSVLQAKDDAYGICVIGVCEDALLFASCISCETSAVRVCVYVCVFE